MKNKLKYYVASMLAIMLILSLIVPVSASAAGTPVYQVGSPEQLRDLLVQKMKERADAIEIKYTGKPLRGQNQPHLLVQNYTKRLPELSYLHETSGFSMSYQIIDSVWDIKVSFHYANTKEEETFVFQKADTVLRSILRAGMTEQEKLEAIVTYIYENVEYDYDQLNFNTNPISQTSYGAAKYGLAVCEGYSEYAQILFEKAGLTSYLVSGFVGPIGHQWNLVKINGVWRHVDPTWHRPDYPYINHTTNQYLKKQRTWNYQDFPATPDSPPINPPVEIKKAALPKVEVKRVDDYTLIETTGVEPGDTLILYNENRKIWFYKDITPDDPDFYWVNGQGRYQLFLTDYFNDMFDYQGTFYLSRVNEVTYESDMAFLTYDFRVKTKPIPVSAVRVQNNFSGYDFIQINHSFSNFGDVYLYNEKGARIDSRFAGKGPDEISFYVQDIEALGKVIYLSWKEDNGIESTKTAIPVPPLPKSKSLAVTDIQFSYDKFNGVLAFKNATDYARIKVYRADTKALVASGSNQTKIIIPNANQYSKLLITATSYEKAESAALELPVPRLPGSKALTAANITYFQNGSTGILKLNSIASDEEVIVYDSATRKQLAKGKGNAQLTIKGITGYKQLVLTRKASYTTESSAYTFTIPAKSKALSNSNFTFSLSGANGLFTMKNLGQTDEFIIYDGATKKVLSKGKGNARVVIKNISSYKQVSMTRKSANQLESSPYSYTLPKLISKALTSKNVKVAKADKRAKFTFANIPKGAVITLYDGKTNRKIASFSIKTTSHTYYLADAKKYSKVHVKITESGKAASSNYTVSIPR